jgi:hypothetical protein
MRKTVFTLVLAILLVSLTTTVLADGPDGDVVVWGNDYTLAAGQEIKGDLVVLGGNAVLEAKSQVQGSVNVFGGNLTISGNVDGDVNVVGGNVNILSPATIRGQVVAVGGQVTREPGADVRGGEIEGLPNLPNVPRPPSTPRVPNPPQLPRSRTVYPWQHDWLKTVGSVFRSAFSVVLMIVLGVLVVVFIPRHTETVAETMVKKPMESFLAGLAALITGTIGFVIIAVIATLLLITICLAPIGLLLLLPFLVAGIAVLFGWIAAGLLLGTKFLRVLTHREPNQIVAVAVGILGLVLASYIPCVGWALALIVATWGLGAVIYSLFGTRSLLGTPAGSPPSQATTDYDPRMDQE